MLENAEAEIIRLLEICASRKASDLHLSAGLPPVYRINGQVQPDANSPVYSAEDMELMADVLMNDAQQLLFQREMTLDMGFSLGNDERYRINIYREQHGVAMAIRYLDRSLKTLEALGLPPQVGYLSSLKSGLVLVCGATGSGKSTTLTALLDEINRTQYKHILTIEDPIEFVHKNQHSIVHQRELHSSVPDFAGAVRAAMREDPDVIMVGEIRDIETMRAALAAAETGHLVFSTLHTNDAVGVVERLIGSFPGDEQPVARQRIAHALKGVLVQNLVVNMREDGREVLTEVLLVTPAVANLIETGKTRQIYTVMESSNRQGMQTLDQALARLVQAKRLDADVARSMCRDLHSFERMLTH